MTADSASPSPEPGSDSRLRIVVCDDHPLFRRAVVTALEEAGFNIVAEAADGVEAYHRAIDHAPDVVLMDLRMPKRNGIEATAAIRRVRPWTKVLVLTVSDDMDEIVSAFAAGAMGHLRKEESMTVLPDALRAIHDGGVILGPALARAIKLEIEGVQRRVEDAGRSTAAQAPWGLTERQAKLFDCLADGADIESAASALGIEVATARTEARTALEGLHRLSELLVNFP